MTSARSSYRERREAAFLNRPAPTPDEIDDRQVDIIESAWATLDEWIADGLPLPDGFVERQRAKLPPRLVVR